MDPASRPLLASVAASHHEVMRRTARGIPVGGFSRFGVSSLPPTDRYLRDPLAESLLAHGDRLPEGQALLARLREGWGRTAPGVLPRVAVRGLVGSARAYLAAWLQHATGRTVLCVVPHGDAFDEARDDLEYFRGAGDVLRVPRAGRPALRSGSRRIPGITAAAPARRSRGSRAGERGLVLATVRGVLQRTPAPARLDARAAAARASAATSIPRRCAERLVFMGYERLPEVEAMGHFARRGGILDIYAVGLADPLRLEFDGDTLRSLRRFDAGTQRSLEKLAGRRVPPRYEVVVDAGRSRRGRSAPARRARRRATSIRADGCHRPGDSLFHEGMERFAAHYDPDARLARRLPAGRRDRGARRPGQARRARRRPPGA